MTLMWTVAKSVVGDRRGACLWRDGVGDDNVAMGIGEEG